MGVALQVASSTCVYSWRSSWSGNRLLETLRKLPSREYTAEFLNPFVTRGVGWGGVMMCTSRKEEIAKSRLPQTNQPLYSFNYFQLFFSGLMKWWKLRQARKETDDIPQWEEDYKLSPLPEHSLFWEYLEVGNTLFSLYCIGIVRDKVDYFSTYD